MTTESAAVVSVATGSPGIKGRGLGCPELCPAVATSPEQVSESGFFYVLCLIGYTEMGIQ